MYCLTVIARPKPDNPEHESVGEAYVTAWIVADNEEQATTQATTDVTDSGWNVIGFDGQSICDDQTYDSGDDEHAYYQQAKIDQAVYVYHTCPRYPVYFFRIKITEPTSKASANEAHAWILNDIVCENYSPYETDFWSGERLNRALNIVSQTIADNGFTVVKVLDQNPVGPEIDGPDRKFFDEAEDDGLCVVIVQDLQSDETE